MLHLPPALDLQTVHRTKQVQKFRLAAAIWDAKSWLHVVMGVDTMAPIKEVPATNVLQEVPRKDIRAPAYLLRPLIHLGTESHKHKVICKVKILQFNSLHKLNLRSFALFCADLRPFGAELCYEVFPQTDKFVPKDPNLANSHKSM